MSAPSPDRVNICLVHQKSLFPFIFEDAERLGVDLTLLHRPDQPAPPKLKAIKQVIPFPLDDEERALEELIRIRSDVGFDGLLSLWDGALPFVTRAAARLGLPNPDPEGTALTRDKGRVREVLAQAGLNCPRYFRLAQSADLPPDGEIPYPMVVKPAHGFGSMGVIRANHRAELVAAVDKVAGLNHERLREYCDGQRDIVVEQYIDGDEYVVETFAQAGRIEVVSVGFKGRPQGPYFEEGLYIAPTRAPRALRDRVSAQAVAALRAIGLQNGPAHTELRLGAGDQPFILDIGARIGGSGASGVVVYNSWGIDMSKLTFDFVTGQLRPEQLDFPDSPRSYATWYPLPVGAGGVLRGFRGLDEVSRDPELVRFVQLSPFGHRLLVYPDFSGYPGIIFTKHKSYEDAERYIQQIDARLRPIYE